MKISILTIMPDLFGDFLRAPVLARAVRNGTLEVEIIDIKEYAHGSFRHIDDSPFGGGAGMVMRCQPVLDALRDCRQRGTQHIETQKEACSYLKKEACSSMQKEACSSVQKEAGSYLQKGTALEQKTVLLSPAGRPYTQQKAHAFSKLDHLILLCGHYEGMDARIESHVDELVSIGDYVLTGGELAAQVIVDSVARLLPGSLREESTREESFENGLLEYPQYTQPAVYEGEPVPEILRSGDHERIRRWRLRQSLLRTKNMRPDLFAAHVLTKEERELLDDPPGDF